MKVQKSDLTQITAQASCLSERLGKQLQVTDSEQQLTLRLHRWCKVSAHGNWEKFQKRLLWDGLDVEQVQQALRSLPVVDSQILPVWSETLRAMIETASNFHPPSLTPINPQTLAFQELLLPTIFVARQQLLIRLGTNSLSDEHLPLKILSESSYLTFECSLLEKLLNLSAKTLTAEYSHFVALEQKFPDRMGIESQNQTNPQDKYNTFVEKLLGDGMLGFFQQYPVLGRLMATAVDFWVEAIADFLQRLQADIPAIQQIFSPLQSHLGKVIDIQPSLSDPHHQGRTVIALTFKSGLKLVYKPKGLKAEVAFTQFLDWCNQQDISLPFKVLKICDRSDYGWVEYIEHLPCIDKAAAQRFYQRSGMLLCLLHILRVTDCHHENLVANGEHFVLVDMETLMQPEAKLMTDFPEETEVEKIVGKQFWDSVVRTGLLPRWNFLENGYIAYQNNALSRCQNHPSPALTNVPMLDGIPLEGGDYLDEIVWGFEQIYRLLISRKHILLAEDSPLAALKNVQVRFMFRMSQVYAKILQHIQSPKWLRNGIDRSIEIDHLSRAFLVVDEKPHYWGILSKELQAMEQLDIPYFSACPGSDELVLEPGESLAEYFQEPSYKTVQTQLENLSEADLARQVEIIKGCFYAEGKAVNLERDSITLDSVKSQSHSLISLTKQQLLQEAMRLAEEIQAQAIWGNDGSVKWIGFNYFPNAKCFQFEPLGDNLYNGNSGIALFLAALDYVRGTNQFRELVMGALFSTRKFLQTFDFESHRRFVRQGIGGGMGLGSLIYGLVTISQFLKEPALVEDATGIANFITPELIATDQQFNIIYGASGAILGLLSLYHHTQEPKILERAINCGQHLLNHQVKVAGIPQTWNILQQGQYTGFFHGAGGIAYALLRLYAITADSAYLAAAKAAMTYEWSVFLQQTEKNIQFSRFDIAGEILLARLASLSILNTDDVYQELEIVLRTTRTNDLIDVDAIECGNFAKMEMLLLAAQKLNRPELREEAIMKAFYIVNAAQLAGGYQFIKLPISVFNPGLFHGTAGIGYELLRVVEDLLPSVLSFCISPAQFHR
ncbi:MAG: type 2 lanthipeptide synthetase LanM family protein [Nostoc sp. DedQUE12b]|uniref:type 2 lanthipeptide synthetase LanM family protein n=1 Tax=Nostoc sp. DedQUE12b TaxID=3075398 RepID=UPI002AD40A80|nr:type 2 lanthipeptide synthetase LanM family protein [Nostoc sp. DedQUE12b]MDZ8089202.1 type 2 lanthipeptide synthetase LanM family protein [Nostoc sp. DedQUE12b]